MFAVEVKTDCEHLEGLSAESLDAFSDEDLDVECNCQEDNCTEHETWICLHCKKILCSRYANGHMLRHGSDMSHPVALSFMDSSVWCFECDSYIDHAKLRCLTTKAGQKNLASIAQG